MCIYLIYLSHLEHCDIEQMTWTVFIYFLKHFLVFETPWKHLGLAGKGREGSLEYKILF